MIEQLPPQRNCSSQIEPREDPPPILGTWRRMYLVVISWIIFLILAFYLFARRFAP